MMRQCSLFALAASLGTSLWAGGPLAANPDGRPVLWNLDAPILDAPAAGQVPYRPDLGGLGRLSEADAVQFTSDLFQVYEDIPTSRIAFENVGPPLSPAPVLQAGDYFIAVANGGAGSTTFEITATVTPPATGSTRQIVAQPTLVPLASGVPLGDQPLPSGGGQYIVQLSPQYVIGVPEGASSLRIRTRASSGNVDVFVRRGAPVGAGEAGELLFDHASQAPGLTETLEILPVRTPVDVTLANVGHYVAGVSIGQNLIVFDRDGSIHAALFGQGTGVLGFFNNRAPDAAGHFTEGFVVLNGGWIDGNPFNGEIGITSFRGIFTHEFGHFLGLDHSQVNGESASLSAGGEIYPGFTPGQQLDLATPYLETVFPFVFTLLNINESEIARQGIFISSAFTIDLAFDDITTVSTLYPEPGFITASGSAAGGLAGRVLRADGITPASGVNVVVRRVLSDLGASPFPPPPGTRAYDGPIPIDADGVPGPPQHIAATDSLVVASNRVSGAFGPGGAPEGPPVAGSGFFRFDGLPPGSYQISIEEIMFNAVGGSRIGPFTPQLDLIREETWSGGAESDVERFTLPVQPTLLGGDFETADLSAFSHAASTAPETKDTVPVNPGALSTALEIVLEAPSPEGDVRRVQTLGTTTPIEPPQGASQLLITTSGGFAGSVAQRFLPPPDARALAFHMNFLTNEQGADPAFADQAILTVQSPLGVRDAAVLADSRDAQLPLHSSTGFARASGDRTVTVGDLDLLPAGEPLAVRWSAADGFDPQIGSALLLDGIHLMSEEPAQTTVSALPGLTSFAGWRFSGYEPFRALAGNLEERTRLTLSAELAEDRAAGHWLSPDDTLPWRPDSVYRLRFHLRSDRDDRTRNPLVRLRVYAANAKAWLEQRLESTPASVVTPSPQGVVAEVWFDPPDLSADQGGEELDDMLLVFEVDDFSSQHGAAITLDRVEADRFPRAQLDAAAVPLRSYQSFRTGEVGLSENLEEIGLEFPDIDLRSTRVEFETEEDVGDGLLGEFGEAFSVANASATPGRLIRATFNISTEENPAALTRIRPRLIFGADQQLNASLDIFPRALGADPTGFAPLPRAQGGRDYTVLLPVPAGASVTPEIGWALGVIDFESDRGGAFSLNRVDIEQIDPTLLH